MARLLIHAFIASPAPTAIVTPVTLERKSDGLHTVSRIPTIAAGIGSLLDFSFEIGETYTYRGDTVGYLEARCPDGVFKVNFPKLLFRNEARTPGVAASTMLKGGLAIPCTPKG